MSETPLVNDIRKKLAKMELKAPRPRLIDIFTVDLQDGTFDLIYVFHHENELVDVRFRVKEIDELDSIRDLYAGAEYMEREVMEMMGLRFKGVEGPFLLDVNSPKTPLRKPLKPVATTPEVKPDG